MKHVLFILWFVFASTIAAHCQVTADNQVDVELVLAVDVSGSMSPTELRIQRRGYAEALKSDEVWNAIDRGLIGSIAVMYVEWAFYDLQKVIVPWTKISRRQDAHDFADRLLNAEYANMQNTSIVGAIRFGAEQLETNDWYGLRRVVDISGDGPNNQGGLVTSARDAAVDAGIIINGLPIVVTGQVRGRGSFTGDLSEYYESCVIGGPGSFVIPVTRWEEFGEAVRRKLVWELAEVAPAHLVVQANFNPATDYDCEIGEKLSGSWQSENYNGRGVNQN
ncbi:MAG: DUF1194 domain-containing protein [Pseudomonadota bacterium]